MLDISGTQNEFCTHFYDNQLFSAVIQPMETLEYDKTTKTYLQQ